MCVYILCRQRGEMYLDCVYIEEREILCRHEIVCILCIYMYVYVYISHRGPSYNLPTDVRGETSYNITFILK